MTDPKPPTVIEQFHNFCNTETQEMELRAAIKKQGEMVAREAEKFAELIEKLLTVTTKPTEN